MEKILTMNKSQYYRFFLVLLFPLLALGWWSAEANVFFDTHIIQCMEDYSNKQYYCYSFEKSQEHRIIDPNVFLSNKAILVGGFHEKVVLRGIIEVEYQDGVEHERIIGAGEEIINVGRNIVGNSNDGVCTLSPVSDVKGSFVVGEAALTCSNRTFGTFSFLDKKTAEKYMNLFVSAEKEAQKISKQERYEYVVSLLIPLAIFLLSSGTVNLLKKIVLFVRYGLATKTKN